MTKALALDALYQVLDNRVFRILLVLALIPIVLVLVVGFREEGIVILFGVKSWSYADLAEALSMGRPQGANPDYQGMAISGLIALFVDGLGGSFGVMLSIAATAFFVPRMTEKGAADVLFHKPIPRALLFLSRYLAGLIFVALIALFAVVGIYLGLLLVSGYHDPGILWAPLTITYLFGLVHCVSMLIGVVTRSTVAAILVTLIFFFGNGCIHQGWILKEQVRAQAFERDAVAEAADDAALDDEQDGAVPEGDDDDGAPGAVRILFGVLDGLHFVLPKTTDAAHVTAKLRSSFERGWLYEDPETRFAVLKLPEGLETIDVGAAPLPLLSAADLLGPAVLAAATEDQDRSVVLRMRPLGTWEDEFMGRPKTRTESARKAAEELAALVRAELALPEDAVREEESNLGEFSQIGEMGPLFLPSAAREVSWSDGTRAHHVTLLSARGRLMVVDVSTPAELDAESRAGFQNDVMSLVGIKNETAQQDWYTQRIGWTAPWRFNLFFSIGSSLAFAVIMLGIGIWRLGRIDF